MKVKLLALLGTIGLALAIALPAHAAGDQLDSVSKGCEKELKSYCKDVTPGEKRTLACLYAFSDKLSPQCESALLDAAVLLEQAVVGLVYVVNECQHDLEKHCGNIPVGGGRVLACLDKQGDKLRDRCRDALKATGLK